MMKNNYNTLVFAVLCSVVSVAVSQPIPDEEYLSRELSVPTLTRDISGVEVKHGCFIIKLALVKNVFPAPQDQRRCSVTKTASKDDLQTRTLTKQSSRSNLQLPAPVVNNTL